MASIEVQPLTKHVGARLTGIDVRQPLTPDEVAAIDAGMDRYAVLVLPGQDITDEQQIAFTAQLRSAREKAPSGRSARRREPPGRGLRRRLQPRQGRQGISRATTAGACFKLGNRLWHSDASFRAIPAKYSIL